MASTTFELSVDRVMTLDEQEHLHKVLELIAVAHGMLISSKVVEPKLTYKIEQDQDPSNPRKEWDNVGVMFCKHGQYTLGDEDADNPIRPEYIEDRDGPVFRDDIAICLPLYLYDHSGITISHGKFSCPWDSGQVGWHYITKAKLKEEFDGDEAKATKCLEAELKTYDDYLQGNVWGYVIENEEGDDVDSCWGFYGDELEETGMLGDVAAEHVEGLKEAWERRFG